MLFYRVSVALLKVFYVATGGIKLIGLDNIPKSGGVILAANHISLADPPAVGIYSPRQVHYMAKEQLFKFPLGIWMRGVGSFPVRRGTGDRRALKRAIEMLGQGRVICIFPEGTRSPDGKLQSPELGIGLVALKSRCPIVPAAIRDSDKVLPPHSKRVHRHRITVTYGPPFDFPDLYESPNSRAAIEEVGRRVMEAIRGLQTEGAD